MQISSFRKVDQLLQKEPLNKDDILWSAHFTQLQYYVPCSPAIFGLMPLFCDNAHSMDIPLQRRYSGPAWPSMYGEEKEVHGAEGWSTHRNGTTKCTWKLVGWKWLSSHNGCFKCYKKRESWCSSEWFTHIDSPVYSSSNNSVSLVAKPSLHTQNV